MEFVGRSCYAVQCFMAPLGTAEIAPLLSNLLLVLYFLGSANVITRIKAFAFEKKIVNRHGKGSTSHFRLEFIVVIFN